jgi:hypothetical protein
MRNGAKKFYAKARAQCARRQADTMALQARPDR